MFRTFLFQKHPALCDDYGHISVYIAFALLICKGYGDVRISDTILEGNTKYTNRSLD